MVLIVMMLNPAYDVLNISQFISFTIKERRVFYIGALVCYFILLLYLGMYIPLMNLRRLIFSTIHNEYEKMILLSTTEKSYIIAGFSLFLVVVITGLRALLIYTARLLAIKGNNDKETLCEGCDSKTNGSTLGLQECILPNLLQVKRSISYDTILVANDLKDHLKKMVTNFESPETRKIFSTLLEKMWMGYWR